MSEQGELVETSRKQWSSEPAFIASMAAAAVGLGNLWRFPYVMGENGGGAFVVAYLLSLFVLVLPIMMLEVAAGRLSQGSTVGTYRKVHRFGAWYGWFVVAVTVAITSYYLVITGWTMGYAFDAVVGNVRTFDVFGQGYLVTYGSFIPSKTNVPRATLLVAAFQTSIALLAGLMIFLFVFSFDMESSQGTALGTASALSHTPLKWQINGEPVLSFIDRVIGGEVIIFSGLFGAALLCWRVPRRDLLAALGSDNPWWVWRIYTIGRYLPIEVLLWAILSLVLELIG